MGPAYERIVSTTFDLEDPDKEYERLRAMLRLSELPSRSSASELSDALEKIEEAAQDAVELLVNAKVELASFELDAKIRAGAMREQATAVLEQAKAERKAAGEPVGKAITNDDVEMIMAQKFPDEWRDLEKTREKNRLMVKVFEEFVTTLRERARDLRALVGKARDS